MKNYAGLLLIFIGLFGLLLSSEGSKVLATISANSFSAPKGSDEYAFLIDERSQLYSVLIRIFSFLMIAVGSLRFFVMAENIISEGRARETNFPFVDRNDEHVSTETINLPKRSQSIFRDSIAGFDDFAKIKGYEAHITVTNQSDNLLNLRMGSDVDRARMQIDLEEYVNLLFDGGKFSDLPVVISGKEHTRLSKIIRQRVELLKLQLEAQHNTERQEIYQEIVTGILSLRGGVPQRLPPSDLVPRIPNIEIHNHATGHKDMTTNISAKNSPGAVLTNKSKIRVGDIKINVDDTETVQPLVANIDEAIELLKQSDIENGEKYVVQLELLKDELQAEESDPGMLATLLDRIKSILGLAEKGTNLYEKISSLIAQATS